MTLRNEPAIDVLTAGPIESGVTVAHRRTAGKYDPKGNNWISSRWPACTPKDSKDPGGEQWRQVSASHAAQLGAVGCTEAACFGSS